MRKGNFKYKRLRPIIALAVKPPPGRRVKAQKTGPQAKIGAQLLYNAWESFNKAAVTLAAQVDKGLIEFDSNNTMERASSSSHVKVQNIEQLIGPLCRTTVAHRWENLGITTKRQRGDPAGNTILDRMTTACNPPGSDESEPQAKSPLDDKGNVYVPILRVAEVTLGPSDPRQRTWPI